MRIANVGKSVGLVGLLLTSLMIGLVTVPTASAVNETSAGEFFYGFKELKNKGLNVKIIERDSLLTQSTY